MTIIRIPTLEQVDVFRVDSYKDGKLEETTSLAYFQQEQELPVSLEGSAHIVNMGTSALRGSYYNRYVPRLLTFIFYDSTDPKALRGISRKLKKAGGKNLMWSRDSMGLLDMPKKGDKDTLKKTTTKWGDQALAAPVVWFPINPEASSDISDILNYREMWEAFQAVDNASSDADKIPFGKPRSEMVTTAWCSGAALSMLNQIRLSSSDLHQVMSVSDDVVKLADITPRVIELIKSSEGVKRLFYHTKNKVVRDIMRQAKATLDAWPYERSWDRLQREAEALGLEVDWKCRKKQSRIDKKRVELARSVSFRDFYSRTKPLVSAAMCLTKKALGESYDEELKYLIREGHVSNAAISEDAGEGRLVIVPTSTDTSYYGRNGRKVAEDLLSTEQWESFRLAQAEANSAKSWDMIKHTLDKGVPENTSPRQHWLRALDREEIRKCILEWDTADLSSSQRNTVRHALGHILERASLSGENNAVMYFTPEEWIKINEIIRS